MFGKYILTAVLSNNNGIVHDQLLDTICYLGYFVPGERGWFLSNTESDSVPHRIHTSKVRNVSVSSDTVAVTTENSKYIFKKVGTTVEPED